MLKELIKNVPEYAYSTENPYWVFTTDTTGNNWFFGAYTNALKASEVALEISAKVINIYDSEVLLNV